MVAVPAERPHAGRSSALLWVPVAALVAQQALRLIHTSAWVSAVLHAAALVWLAVIARRSRWAFRAAGALAAVGGALNLLAISLSGGEMPVTRAAIAHLSTSGKRNIVRSHVLVTDGIGSIIGDRFAIPVLHLVASPGDLVIVLGAAIGLGELARRRLQRRRPAASSPSLRFS